MQRITEIDLLRTLAIILMIIYHAAYDLHEFYNWQIDLWGDGWQTFRILIASLFLVVSGMASNFSRNLWKRGWIIIGAALVVSLATYLYDSSTFIYFGILHCIGLGMLVLIPLKHLKELTILIGIATLMLPALPIPHDTLDYYPFIPWFGLMLIGSGLGHYLYIRNDLRLPITNNKQRITIPSRYALIIYLIHQPIILILLKLAIQ